MRQFRIIRFSKYRRAAYWQQSFVSLTIRRFLELSHIHFHFFKLILLPPYRTLLNRYLNNEFSINSLTGEQRITDWMGIGKYQLHFLLEFSAFQMEFKWSFIIIMIETCVAAYRSFSAIVRSFPSWILDPCTSKRILTIDSITNQVRFCFAYVCKRMHARICNKISLENMSFGKHFSAIRSYVDGRATCCNRLSYTVLPHNIHFFLLFIMPSYHTVHSYGTIGHKA